ncbi:MULTISPECIES: DUF4358 domain-containing protein [Clostridium]|uniref:DUF4358 domain-containing protein n=1 Tax=Clostridium TaxID=1485 RepID=UPI00069D2B06|nr:MULTISPECIES: DUF4358 domain-containing protein [Clostridium]KOF57064.1 hypothetical protein AGR56_10945 [Clostridium sp. DMHC 10]MCD2348071.1 DUF4358 domain-containing protein [Clostridium guangxiense]
MSKIFRLISVVVIIIFMTSGCIDQGSVTVKEFDEKIKNIGDISTLKKEDAKGLEDLYKINKVELTDFALYTSKSKDNPEEILVLKVKYLSSINELRYKIQKRLNERANDFKGSSPEKYKLIKNSLLQDRQNFIIFVISKDKSKVEKAFDKMVKN